MKQQQTKCETIEETREHEKKKREKASILHCDVSAYCSKTCQNKINEERGDDKLLT